MTKKKSESMPAPDEAPALPRRKPVAGYLVCDQCDRVIPYQGQTDMPLIGAPMHRCTDYNIKPFTRWANEDPNRLPIRAWLEGEAS